MREWPVECDVSDLVPVPGEHLLRGMAYAPDELDPGAPPAVVWCLPGGRCTIDYFDLRVEGLDGYSMVRELTDRGLLGCRSTTSGSVRPAGSTTSASSRPGWRRPRTTTRCGC